MGGSFNLGRVFGIQFRIHFTWFVIFFLITLSLSWEFFPASYPDWSQPLYWVMGIITSLLFFISVLAHELAHSLVGRVNGVPIKSITLFIFGGMAQMTKEATRAGAELKMAIAGPACSLAISGIFALLWWLTRGVFEPVAAMAFWLALVNATLAVFNLIPGFPLDGGRVFRSLVWRLTGNYQRATKIATRLGQGVAYAFILGGILIMVLLHEWLSGLWIILIGWFLQNAASISYRQAQQREVLQSFTAAQVMTSDYMAIPPNITVSQLVLEYVLSRGHRLFLVTNADVVKGMVTLQNIKSVPRSNWDTIPVEKIMVPVDQLKAARLEQDALSILEQMDENNINQMLVVNEGRIIGLITRDNLVRFLRTRAELRV
jgi:Zn-dependent protease/predicted transcriptional regulator